MKQRLLGIKVISAGFILWGITGLGYQALIPFWRQRLIEHLLAEQAAWTPEHRAYIESQPPDVQEEYTPASIRRVSRTSIRYSPISIGVSMAWIALGIGWLFMQRWAYTLIRLLTLLGLVAVVPAFFVIYVGPILALVMLLWNGPVLWYLLRPAVKAQFQKRIGH